MTGAHCTTDKYLRHSVWMRHFRTDLAEIEQYLGILVKMGLVHMPRYTCYWSSELRFPAVADVMSRNMFSNLTRYIHFNDSNKMITNRDDPQYDPYFKVRPLLGMLRESCLNIEPEEKMSIDEQMTLSREEIHSGSTFQTSQKSGALK